MEFNSGEAIKSLRLTVDVAYPAQHEVEHPILHYENTDIEDIFQREESLIPVEFRDVCQLYIRELVKALRNVKNRKEQEKVFNHVSKVLRQQTKKTPRKNFLLSTYFKLVSSGEIEPLNSLHKMLITRPSKSQSGVLTVTVLTSPNPGIMDPETKKSVVSQFSCKWDCFYCPNEPGQPRSYLRDEPAVLRANENRWDPVLQFFDRVLTLAQNGHPVDKIELLVLGGTWSSYPALYQEIFIRDLFYAANTFWERPPKRRVERLSLQEEQERNEFAAVKIIGLTLETRPDCINLEEIKRFRRYGCTRVQIGIQHTHDEVLKTVNRQSTRQDAKNAIRLLKDNCYKVDVHLMPNLPGSNPKLDLEMFDLMTNDEDLQVDQWKIYPCEITPFTTIKKWFDEGRYIPYSNEELKEVVIVAKTNTKPWVRLNRVLRDIPTHYQLAADHLLRTDWREEVQQEMAKRNLRCQCIRCREVQGKPFKASDVTLNIREYRGSKGKEFFISFEIESKVLIGFCRLRLPPPPPTTTTSVMESQNYLGFECLKDSALIRELHVYGQLLLANTDDPRPKDILELEEENTKEAQHLGFGKRMLQEAETIARKHRYKKIAVISGVGVKNYYRRHGYYDTGPPGFFLVKDLESTQYRNLFRLVSILILIGINLGIVVSEWWWSGNSISRRLSEL